MTPFGYGFQGPVMRLGVAAALMLSFGFTHDALAQRIAGPNEGSAGLLLSVSAETHGLASNGSSPYLVRSTDHRWSGAAIGGVAGAVVGALVGAVACSQDDTGDSNCVGVTVGAAALLALPGAILGGIIGASIPSN